VPAVDLWSMANGHVQTKTVGGRTLDAFEGHGLGQRSVELARVRRERAGEALNEQN
jgi:hypothetical protein